MASCPWRWRNRVEPVALATERHERGLTDFLNVLDAERQKFAIEDQNAIAQEAVVMQYIALYKALVGGWELYDAFPPLKEAQAAVVATLRSLQTTGYEGQRGRSAALLESLIPDS